MLPVSDGLVLGFCLLRKQGQGANFLSSWLRDASVVKPIKNQTFADEEPDPLDQMQSSK